MKVFDVRSRLNLTDGSVARPLFALAVPVVLSSLLQTAYDLTDTFWVGQYASDHLAALSFGAPLVFLSYALGSGVATTGRILVSQYEGADDRAAAATAAGQALSVAAVVGIVLAAVAWPSIDLLLGAMGAEPAVRPLAVGYLHWILAGLPVLFLLYTVSAALQGYGDTVTPFLLTLGTVLINFVLDPVLVFGYGPVSPMGVEGAAIATLATRGLAALAGVWLLLTGRLGFRIGLPDLAPQVTFLRRVGRLGVPASLEQATIAVSVTAMLFVVGRFDSPVVAAFGIGERVSSVMFLTAVGVGSAAMTMVGQNLGAGKPDRARTSARLAVQYPFLGLTLVGAVTVALAPAIVGVFTTDPAVIDPAADFLRVIGLAFGAEAATRIYAGVFRGAGRTTLALALTGTTFVLVRVPLAFWLVAAGWGETAIWASYALSGVFGAGLGAILSYAVDWTRRLPDDSGG